VKHIERNEHAVIRNEDETCARARLLGRGRRVYVHGCVLVLCFYDYVLIVVQDVLLLSVLDLSYRVSLCCQ